MTGLFTFENFANLGVLLFLQAVLGFGNLLYISIESKQAPLSQQAAVRRNGILIAIALRIILLLANHVSAFLQKNRKYEVLGLFR